jgi:hypothetical protein
MSSAKGRNFLSGASVDERAAAGDGLQNQNKMATYDLRHRFMCIHC